MKKHINALITKFLFIAPVIGLVGPIFSGMNYKIAVIAAAIITLGTYLSADLILLPRMGKIPALIGDAIIALVVYWEITFVTGWARFSLVGMLLSTLAIVFGEIYFHNYLLKTVLRQPGYNKNIVSHTAVNTKNEKSQQINKKSRSGKKR
ncbi:conserved hypothetical protein [Desulfofarcimen acetoxidans DSM 771]|jgi:hypothetical protein|uniref:Integral membrane protein n=1 Tax=Desulfofarcimen acetoxidans (strain ATCC 49208 / DSM 771 / KCTC 5769 / VKM B-1644 / 5575) TaxID=485916 RepID=C8W696_DESAS|nr:YndM family protein [Desulfofarcimen acetoxidans]ACV62185.1 conserved hypothetical protein [Desulfofarcimen acetoxidans DSM 771]